MTPEILTGVLRAMIPGLVAMASYWGIGTDAQNTTLFTAVATVIVALWSAWSNKQASMIASINAADNGVKVVAATSAAPTVSAPLK